MTFTKPYAQETKQPVIAARLEWETYGILREEAEIQRRPLGALIRIILEDYVNKRGTP